MALPRNGRDADVRAAIFREPDRVRLYPDHAGRGSAARRDHAEDTGCFSGLVTRTVMDLGPNGWVIRAFSSVSAEL
jgi:hypothetical protein